MDVGVGRGEDEEEGGEEEEDKASRSHEAPPEEGLVVVKACPATCQRQDVVEWTASGRMW